MKVCKACNKIYEKVILESGTVYYSPNCDAYCPRVMKAILKTLPKEK